MINQRVMATAVIKKGNKYLVLRRAGKERIWIGRWQFPEGGVEFGENPVQTIAREIREETNLRMIECKLLGISTTVIKGVLHVIRIAYEVKAKGTLKLSNAHDKYEWLEKKKIKRLKMIPGLDRDFIDEYLK